MGVSCFGGVFWDASWPFLGKYFSNPFGTSAHIRPLLLSFSIKNDAEAWVDDENLIDKNKFSLILNFKKSYLNLYVAFLIENLFFQHPIVNVQELFCTFKHVTFITCGNIVSKHWCQTHFESEFCFSI